MWIYYQETNYEKSEQIILPTMHEWIVQKGANGVVVQQTSTEQSIRITNHSYEICAKNRVRARWNKGKICKIIIYNNFNVCCVPNQYVHVDFIWVSMAMQSQNWHAGKMKAREMEGDGKWYRFWHVDQSLIE